MFYDNFTPDQICGIFSFWHIVAIVIFAVTATIALVLSRNMKKQTVVKIMKIVAITVVVMEIVKITLRLIKHSSPDGWVPLYFCSLFLYETCDIAFWFVAALWQVFVTQFIQALPCCCIQFGTHHQFMVLFITGLCFTLVCLLQCVGFITQKQRILFTTFHLQQFSPCLRWLLTTLLAQTWCLSADLLVWRSSTQFTTFLRSFMV